jgi:succinoglycan biosynthesis protein ExoM
MLGAASAHLQRERALMPKHVAICVATFRRPAGLKRLLASLDALAFSRVEQPRITVVVIDNDATSPLAGTAAEKAAWSRHPLVYRIEPTQGLASARNACLDTAPHDADVIAFLDDDEWVEPLWLDALLATHASTGAGIIQGPVRAVFSSPPAAWMSASGLYDVGPFLDRQSLESGATGNCLIAREALNLTGVRFDARFNASGGEDTDFFMRMKNKGQRIVAASNAVAFEDVPTDRMRLSWMLKRQYRVGHTLGVVSRVHASAGTPWLRAAKAFARIGHGLGELLLGAVTSSTRCIKGCCNVAWGCGTLAALLGSTVNVYKSR